jgi:hypothetical protein
MYSLNFELENQIAELKFSQRQTYQSLHSKTSKNHANIDDDEHRQIRVTWTIPTKENESTDQIVDSIVEDLVNVNEQVRFE